jgi:hypothetical protein
MPEPHILTASAPASEVATRIAALFDQKPGLMIIKPEEWVGTEDVQAFLNFSSTMGRSVDEAKLVIR